MARKPLLSSPVLNRDDVQSRLTGDDVMSRVIGNDAAKHGRPATRPPASPTPLLERSGTDMPDAAGEAASNSASHGSSKQVSESLSKEVSKGVSTPLLNPAESEPEREPETPQPESLPAAPVSALRPTRERVPTRENKERNIRLSIDVPESVYDRIKQYVHEKKVESTRALTLALYEAFLEGEGY